MTEGLWDDLRDEYQKGSLVAFIGAGVSLAVCGGNPLASWKGLLESGIGHCQSIDKNLGGWSERLRRDLSEGDLEDLLSVAERVTVKLGGQAGGEFGRWLAATVGKLSPNSQATIAALNALDIPIFTTNYDNLLTDVTGRQPVTFHQKIGVDAVVRGTENSIVHLHGHWRDPESVVLGVRSYETILGDSYAQAMLRGLLATRTVVFIGFGAGLSDPNFSALRAWLGNVFAHSTYRHYRLAIDAEVDSLQREHSTTKERIAIVGIGPTHASLVGRLNELARLKIAPQPVDRKSKPQPLPIAPNCFGRKHEIEILTAALLAASARPVPIMGGPGIGKSNLALVTLQEPTVRERFGPRRFFVRCDGCTTAGAVLGELAIAIGLALGDNLENRLHEALGAAPTVVVLDNAETPWESDQIGTEEMLARLAGIYALVLVVAVRGEERPDPARIPWQEGVHLRPLATRDAVDAFVAIAGRRLSADRDLEVLVSAMQGVPLAISLAAYAAQGQPTLAPLVQEWTERRAALLKRRPNGNLGDPRLTSVGLSVELSLRSPRMTDEARSAAAILARLPDGVAHDDFETALGPRLTTGVATLRRLGLAFDEDRRARILAPVREYIASEYAPDNDESNRSVSHYFDLVRKLAPRIGHDGGAAAIKRLLVELGNVESLVRDQLAHANPAEATKICIELSQLFRFSGHGDGTILERAAEAAHRDGRIEDESRCLYRLATIAIARSNYDLARVHLETALQLARAARSISGEVACIFCFGEMALACSDHETACLRFHEALPLFHQIGNSLGEANCRFELGTIEVERQNYDKASELLAHSQNIYCEIGDLLGEANCILSIGDLALRRVGDEGTLTTQEFAVTEKQFDGALKLYKTVGTLLGEAHCIKFLAEAMLKHGDYAGSKVRFEEALALYRSMGNPLGEANCIQNLGRIARRLDDWADAYARFNEALSIFQRIPQPYSIGITHTLMASATRDTSRRRKHLADARAAFESIGRDDLTTSLGDEPDELSN